MDLAEVKNTLISQKAAGVRQAVSKTVPPRVLLPPLYACYTAIASGSGDGGPVSIVMLMGVLRDNIKEMSRADVNLHYKQIFKFFLTALDCRGFLEDDDEDEARAVEGRVVAALVQMILKLSETAFLPLLLKLLDWSTRTDVPSRRQVTLFRAVEMLAGELKSLFIGYYSYFLKNFISALSEPSETFAGYEHLIPEATKYIMTALQTGFMNDDGSFVTKERFKILQTPLVAQLDVRDAEDPETYFERVEHEVMPCVTAL